MNRWVVRVGAEHAEAALARLLAASPAGLEERGTGEFVVYDEPPELPGLISVHEEVVPDGWETAYHTHLGRVVAGRFGVRPPWVSGLESDLVIDPGTAFGAGTHPTTRLCLELIGSRLQFAPNTVANCNLADWGTGTGVLAIAAARVGYRPVFAIDVDPAALDACRSNARANGAGVETRRLDITRDCAPAASTVVANLTLPLLEAAAKVQRRPEWLIASGVLGHQADAIAAAFGMVERERRELDGWAAVVLT